MASSENITHIVLKNNSQPDTKLYPITDIQSVVGLKDKLTSIYDNIEKLVQNGYICRGNISINSMPGNIFHCRFIKLGKLRYKERILKLTEQQLHNVIPESAFNADGSIDLCVYCCNDSKLDELKNYWKPGHVGPYERFEYNDQMNYYEMVTSNLDFDKFHETICMFEIGSIDNDVYCMLDNSGKLHILSSDGFQPVVNIRTVSSPKLCIKDNGIFVEEGMSSSGLEIQRLCRRRHKYVKGKRVKLNVKYSTTIAKNLIVGTKIKKDTSEEVKKTWQTRLINEAAISRRPVFLRARYNNKIKTSAWSYWIVKFDAAGNRIIETSPHI